MEDRTLTAEYCRIWLDSTACELIIYWLWGTIKWGGVGDYMKVLNLMTWRTVIHRYKNVKGSRWFQWKDDFSLNLLNYWCLRTSKWSHLAASWNCGIQIGTVDRGKEAKMWLSFSQSVSENAIHSIMSNSFQPNPLDCSPPGCSIHRILQARILEWLPCPFPGIRFLTQDSDSSLLCCTQILYPWATKE